ncbi:hypothetical protein OG539_41480 [Actinacidiphila glaucinigra]|uniref:hypothetical protein n=1 Tax=Actinacidiphila glaucinigra TaxID=235986 RepID=UPI002DD912D8|nr:hypothetical protein [Actinacidiphila glaucinigra]WSD57777.1 hypothetical protein OIE69_02005 [Actinacidiphila glaucinigra]
MAVSLLPLLAACGAETASSTGGDAPGGGKVSAGSGQLDIPADASDDVKKQYLMENAIAACMKKQGFAYTPEPPTDIASDWANEGADYELTKKFRQKYGFGYAAAAVYPDDPQSPLSKAAQDKPSANAQYLATLTAQQKAAYNKALGGPPDPKADVKGWSGCQATGNKAAYGNASTQERSAEAEEQNQANAQALNGDPKLVGLAQSYASCLKRDGIPVTTTQPTSIGEMVKLQVASSSMSYFVGGADGTGEKHLTKDEALPLLTKEIDLAMKDLACGKDFRATYFPKYLKAPGSTGNG